MNEMQKIITGITMLDADDNKNMTMYINKSDALDIWEGQHLMKKSLACLSKSRKNDHDANLLITDIFVLGLKNLYKKEIEIWGTGVAIREWLYAEDFAKIVFDIIINSKTIGFSEPINIAQNFGLSVVELVEIINHKYNNKFSIAWDNTMPDGAAKKVMDDRKFSKVFPNFSFQDFDSGILNTINYYKSVYPY
jgi:GDP-L-fucose synthase